MVLHGRDEDLVPGPEVLSPVALGHEVDTVGGSPREHDFVIVGRVQEAPHSGTAAVVRLGGHLTQEVDAPMDVGVFLA
jgi:hypothetical protein